MNPRALLAVALLFGASRSVSAQEARVVGCWTLEVGSWDPPLADHEPGFPPPAWFELRGRRGGDEGPAVYGGDWSPRERHWKWSRLASGGVAIVFGAGFAGYHLRLEPRGERLEGRIEAFNDARGRSRAPATAALSSCRRLRSG